MPGSRGRRRSGLTAITSIDHEEHEDEHGRDGEQEQQRGADDPERSGTNSTRPCDRATAHAARRVDGFFTLRP